MVIDEGYFIKYLKNELTEEETRKLVAWVKEKRENSDFLFSLKEAYTYLNYEKDRKEADTEREWHRFVKQEGLGAETDKRRHFRWTRWLSYAAIALLCLAVGWQLNRFYTDDAGTRALMALETEVGQQAKAVLPDGSTVQLNACSHLTYPAEGWDKRRNVYLSGEAIFDVRHRSDDSPFWVHTRHYAVQVLGTCFNVSTYDNETEEVVTLKEGKVEIYAAESDNVPLAVLQPGESFVYDNRTNAYRVEYRSLQQAYAWGQHQIVFEGHTLEQKRGELFRHFGYHFHISPDLHDLRYKATLREESLTEFLQLLKSITPQMQYVVDTVHKTVTLTTLKPSVS